MISNGHWLKEDYKTLEYLHNKHVPLAVIAKRLGKSNRATIKATRRLRIKGIVKNRNRPWTQTDYVRLVILYNKGVSVAKIASKLDRSEATIGATLSILRKKGVRVKRRKQSIYHG